MHLEALKKGRPVFVGSDGGVRIGIATQNDVVNDGEPVAVDLWIDNRTDKPIRGFFRCVNIPLWRVDVFDEAGHRLVGITEQKALDAKQDVRMTVQACASAFPSPTVPAHTCRAPTESGGSNWMLDYKLTPGRYYVFPTMGTDPALYKQGLLITFLEP